MILLSVKPGLERGGFRRKPAEQSNAEKADRWHALARSTYYSSEPRQMNTFWLILLGSAAGSGAGLLAGLIGIGGGIVVVPVVIYGLMASGVPADAAAHVAVGTSFRLC